MPSALPAAFRLAAVALVLLTAGVADSSPEIVECKLGVGGVVKPGCWTPVVINTDDAAGLTARVIAPDVDGAPVVYPLPPVAGGDSTTSGLFRFGRRDATLRVQLLDGEQVVFRQSLELTTEAQPLASTDTLVITVAGSNVGWAAGLLASGEATSLARVAEATDLPTTATGYDAVKLLVLNLDDAAFYRGLGAEDGRIAAINEWVSGGGRLLIIGGDAAEQLLGDGGPLAPLLPGEWAGPLELLDGSPIERFAGADTPLGRGRRSRLTGYQIANARGEARAAVGGDEPVPLVLRIRQGFGEVAVVPLSLARGPLAEWPGTPQLVARAAGFAAAVDDEGQRNQPGKLISRGYSDLAGALQQQLGRGFVGVAVAPMLAFVAAALGYLALIGPGDYFLVRRLFQRSVVAWITLPAVAVAGSLGVVWLTGSLGGVGDKVNQIEVVDFDLATGQARGVLWAQAFCPQASRREVSLDCRWPSSQPVRPTRSFISWLGMPGGGIGGVDRGAASLLSPASEYATSAQRDRLIGLPVLSRSTKAIECRWTASFDSENAAPLEADLRSSGPGVLSGTIVNRTGADLADCWLAHGEWAWRLGDVDGGAGPAGTGQGGAGGTLSLDTARSPIKLTTLLRRDYLGLSADDRLARRLDPQKLSLDALLQLVLLAEAAGGVNSTGLASDYYQKLDLSRELDRGLAVLMARPADGARRSRLLVGSGDEETSGEWGAASPRDRVLYRFVLPVASNR
ncbi:MAG: hypothetical protein AAGJ46_01270 [Planctomycetota bacterium]